MRIKSSLLNIGFDFDGAICDHTISTIKFAEKLDIKLKPRDTVNEQLKKFVSSKKIIEELKHYRYGKGTKEGIMPKGLISCFKYLRQQKLSLFIIS